MLSVALATLAAVLGTGARVEAQPAEGISSPAEVMGDPGDLESFRADLEKYAEDMKAVAGAAGLPSALDETLQRIATLTSQDLSMLQAAHAKSPNWRTHPRTLGSLLRVRRLGAPLQRAVIGPQITSDDCPTAINAGITQTDVEIAADVALAADAILEAIPTDFLSAIARAVAVGLWAIPQGILRAFEHLHNIAQVCQADAFESGVNNQLVSIVNNDNSNRNQILNNDNSNTTTILNNTNASTTQIINTSNSNTTNILTSIGANADLAEARQIEDNLARDSCPAWMYTPEYADAARTIRLGGRLAQVVAVVQGAIDNASTLQTVKRRDIECARHSLSEAVEKAENRTPYRADRVCHLLLDAYEKITPSCPKGHDHGHSDHDGYHRSAQGTVARPAGSSARR
jgi:hypothetical protein